MVILNIMFEYNELCNKLIHVKILENKFLV